MDEPTLRRAVPGDADHLADLAQAAYAPYVGRMQGRRPAPMDADYPRSVAQDVVWVAEVDAEVAGFLVLVDEQGVTLVENVAVAPRWQGRGLGQRLMALAEQHARETGAGTVRLYTNVVMTDNLRLYAALGYAEVDRRGDSGFERVFMEKALD